MKKIAILILCLIFSHTGANELTIRYMHIAAVLNNIIDSIHTDNHMLDWSKSELVKVRSMLAKEKISKKDHKKICSILMNVLPSFSGSNERKLKRIFAYSLVSALKEGIYDFIGSSFYPNQADLEGIELDGENLTSEEFLQIQKILEDDAKLGKLKPNFSEYTKAIEDSRKP